MPSEFHTAVSNEPEEGSFVLGEEAMSQAPSEGVRGEAGKATAEGIEQVRGYSRPEESLEEMWTPPTAQLPDIGEASFGPPAPHSETVHGPDDRVQVANTAIYPWRVHCSLMITAADNSRWTGTGWFIGPHTVVTAGHVVFIKNSGVAGRDGWVRSINVMPGRNGSTLPYGVVTSTGFRSVQGWTNSADPTYDYGAMILPTNLGNTTGWFGFGVWSDADLLKSVGNISGYPGDKPAGTQWYDARGISSVDSRKVYYDIDTAGGQSGSGVYRVVNGARYGFAIHAYGGSTTNSGTRITTDVFNNLTAWKA